jgi:predicted phosphoribosyltransferase
VFNRLTEIISSLKDGSYLKIKDRYNAALVLSSFLKDQIKDIHPENIIILGIPRGGVIMADVISNKLHITYDIIVVKKLQSPYGEELGIGAILENGFMYLDNSIINSLNISQEYIEQEKIKQIEEIRLRNKFYQPYSKFINLDENKDVINEMINNKTVIVVDDGAASGVTLKVLLKWLKEKNPFRIVVAITIAPQETIELLNKETKYIETILTPSYNFQNVSQYYQDFTQIADEQVINILKLRKPLL